MATLTGSDMLVVKEDRQRQKAGNYEGEPMSEE